MRAPLTIEVHQLLVFMLERQRFAVRLACVERIEQSASDGRARSTFRFALEIALFDTCFLPAMRLSAAGLESGRLVPAR